MGMDFVALLSYPGIARVTAALESLESGTPFPETSAVEELWQSRGFAELYTPWPVWVGAFSTDTFPGRPQLPNLERSLFARGFFFLTFGSDAVCLYHCLRWAFFVSDPEWQSVMIGAVRHVGQVLQASDCIITCDFSPIFHAFFQGRSFAEAILAAGPEDFERSSIAELRQLQEAFDGSTQTAVGYWRPLKLAGGS
jgi:hypothetical protein